MGTLSGVSVPADLCVGGGGGGGWCRDVGLLLLLALLQLLFLHDGQLLLVLLVLLCCEHCGQEGEDAPVKTTIWTSFTVRCSRFTRHLAETLIQIKTHTDNRYIR